MSSSDNEVRITGSAWVMLLGSFLISFSRYIDLYNAPIMQAIEVVINICVLGGYLCSIYGLGAAYWFGKHPKATYESYLNDFGGLLVIAAILILIWMNLGSILTSFNQTGLGLDSLGL